MTPTATAQRNEPASDTTAIRPFQVNIPEAELTDLRRRINATRFPEKEPVADFSQGVPLATVEKLARYWATEYDWRKVEARLNAVPNFITEIDGLDIHFIHVRSKHEHALPVIVTHGWPGSIVEQLKLIEPLTNPTAHGGSAADAFHVVIPSMPGYGFSGRPATTGWGAERIARAWDVLMKRLGYARRLSRRPTRPRANHEASPRCPPALRRSSRLLDCHFLATAQWSPLPVAPRAVEAAHDVPRVDYARRIRTHSEPVGMTTLYPMRFGVVTSETSGGDVASVPVAVVSRAPARPASAAWL